MFKIEHQVSLDDRFIWIIFSYYNYFCSSINACLIFVFSIFLAPIDANADPVLHTCQTVGRLSNKVARRVYRTVSRQVKMLKKEDVQEYVASLIAVLRLTQYLNFINEKVQSGQAVVDNENEKNEQLNKQQHHHHQQHQQPTPLQNNHANEQ